jgi:hypothetical protein
MNLLNENESVTYLRTAPVNSVAILRIRNEELIIKDTLDHLSEFVDGICVYDDNSSDRTLEIVRGHPAVILVIENQKWMPGETNRLISETRHREILRQFASDFFDPNWFFCCDADERYIGNINKLLNTPEGGLKPLAVRLSLFDAYLTPEDKKPFMGETQLIGFRKFFGCERRDIIMIWNKLANAKFLGLDSREPTVNCEVETLFYVQHFGKSLSEKHWEETCDYYLENFPRETYGDKWQKRKGKAIHELSDFGTPLYIWSDRLFENAIQTHPFSNTFQKIRRVLITNIWFNVFSGSEIVCLELYSYLESIGIDVEIVANTVSDKMKNYCEINNIKIYSNANFIAKDDYDLVWVHHNYIPVDLIGKHIGKLSRARFVFHHMSPFEPLCQPYFPEIESRVATSILTNSLETLTSTSSFGIETQRIEIFNNPAPSVFKEGARQRKSLQNFLFVTNHPPSEVVELMDTLVHNGLNIRHLGMGSPYADNHMILNRDIEWADAIVTIGKSVQYALLNSLPVYVYDIYGGDGWLDSEEKLGLSANTNFTGRPLCRKISSQEILNDLFDGFENASHFAFNLSEQIRNRFDLSHQVNDLLKKLEKSSFGAIKELDQSLLKMWSSYVSLISREASIHKDVTAGDLIVLRDSAVSERDSAVSERDSAVSERDSAVSERDSAVSERDSVLNSSLWMLFKPYRKLKNKFLN